MSHVPYSSAFESIMYVMVRICLFFPMFHMQSVLLVLKKVHWQAVKLVFCYLWVATNVGVDS